MKLLEERTEQSKNEMERMEALEELQEMNKRTVKVDYDTMLSKYDKIRAEEAKKQEQMDEDFIKAVFGKEPSGVKVKRLLDEDDSDEESPRTKVPKPANATDILSGETNGSSSKSQKNHIASMVKKSGITKNLLVKPKNSLVMPKNSLVKPKTNLVQPKITESKPVEEKIPTSNSLGLLANYSDSDEASD